MSFTQIVMQKDGTIHAISDKRLGQGSSINGQIVNWSWLNDDQLKIKKLADNVYLTGGSVCDVSDRLYNHITEEQHTLASEIIEIAESFDRIVEPPFGKHTHDPAIIFGLYDDGKSFIWKGERDGTCKLDFANGKSHIIEISGGLNSYDRISNFFVSSVKGKKDVDFAEVIKCTLKFAASIDHVISEAYDFVTVCPVEKKSTEDFYTKNGRQILTADSGKRMEMTGDDNNLIFYDSSDQEVLRIDDDISLESFTVHFNNYPIPPTYTYTYGPGVRIGGATGRRLEISRYGLASYDDNGDLSHSLLSGSVRLDAYESLYVRDGGLQWQKGWSGGVGYKDPAGNNKTALYVSGILINPDL